MADQFSAYGWGQSLSDMLGGYLGESDKIRQENERKNELAQQHEQRILEYLATSDDTNLKTAAATAMLTQRKPGPGVLAKWYNQQAEHPAFEQVQTILGQTKQPWLTDEQKAASVARGTRTGSAEGIFGTYKKYTGQEPPQGFVERTLQSMSGGAQRNLPLQSGNIGRKGPDGKVVYEPGFFDPSSGEYYDQSYTPVFDAVDFRRTQSGSSTAGNFIWQRRVDGKFDVFHRDDPTHVIGTTDTEYAMPPGPAPAIIQPGAGQPARAVSGGRGPNQPYQITDLPGTARPQETLRESYQRLDALKREIEAQAQRDDPNIMGRDRSIWEPALEFYAQKNGIPSYRTLVNQLREIDEQLRRQPQNQQQNQQPQAGTPPPGPITPMAAAGAGATKPRETAATGPAARRPGAGAGLSGNLPTVDPQKILDLLHIETGQKPQQRPQQPQP
jgi:hypothetical protein